MKRCPKCRRDYYDETLVYCLDDGLRLLDGQGVSSEPSAVAGGVPSGDEATTAILTGPLALAGFAGESPAKIQIPFDNGEAEMSRLASAFDRKYESLGPLIGRLEEIRALTEFLEIPGIRLVTLTGIGGTGKTRLSIEVARLMRAHFPDGVFFMELSSINDPMLVPPAIAHVLGIKETGREVIVSLRNHLHERSALIVLDNMEQVLSAGVQLGELLKDTVGVKILVTSREPLGLSLETEYRLAPLALPEWEAERSISELMHCDAVQLFVQRAKQARPDFELTEDDAPAVAAICRKLDGLPLGLELAAARAKVLSPTEILAKLENSLALLTGGSKDLPDRQQTMRAAIEWSCDLLSEIEKKAFGRLSVFEGGFTFSQAEIVISDSEIRDAEILDIVTSLAEKSLLTSERRQSGDLRFKMLELVRDFALEILSADDASRSIHRSHANHFLNFAEEAAPHLTAIDSAEWLKRLETDHDNFRAAIRWSMTDEVRTASRIMASLRNLWIIHGHIREGRQWFQEALDKKADLSPDLRCELLTGLGNMAQFQGDYSCSLGAYIESLEQGRAANDQKKIARSLRGIGAVEYIQSDFTSARERIVEALAISRSLHDEFGMAAALSRLGDIAIAEGKSAEGRLPIRDSLGIFRKLGNRLGIISKLNNLAIAELLEGNAENAVAHFVESVTTARDLGDRINTRIALDGFAALAFVFGEFRNAAILCGAAISLGETMGVELEPVEQRLLDFYFEGVRAALDDRDFANALVQGRRMKVDEATEFALGLMVTGKRT